tara:strand:+ start:170 stop:415 length:246 start_codon:yes stop_codon:yes gene_type:complete
VAVIEKDQIISLLLDRLEVAEKLIHELKDEIRHLKEQLVIKNSSNSSKHLLRRWSRPSRPRVFARPQDESPEVSRGIKGTI